MIQRARVLCSAALLVALAGASLACQGPPRGAEGTQLLGVASILNRAVVNAVIHKDVAQAKGITPTTPLADKLAALRGLTLGVSRPGSLTFQIGTYFIQQAGLTPGNEASVLAVGGGTAMLASLEQRKVDVIVNSPPEPEEAMRQGIGVMFI